MARVKFKAPACYPLQMPRGSGCARLEMGDCVQAGGAHRGPAVRGGPRSEPREIN